MKGTAAQVVRRGAATGRKPGSSLQDAIQELTDVAIPVTTSHDTTGDGRSQVLDRNWKVCEQNVAAGATITAGSRIDFGAVELTERC